MTNTISPLKADDDFLIKNIENDCSHPRFEVCWQFEVVELLCPRSFRGSAYFNSCQGTAPTMSLIVGDQAVAQRLCRGGLELCIKSGTDGEPAIIEPLLAMDFVDFPAHTFDEILDFRRLCAAPSWHNDQGLQARRIALLVCDVAISRHAANNPVASFDSSLTLANGMIIVWRFWHCGQVSGFRDCQLRKRLIKIIQCRSRNPVR